MTDQPTGPTGPEIDAALADAGAAVLNVLNANDPDRGQGAGLLAQQAEQ